MTIPRKVGVNIGVLHEVLDYELIEYCVLHVGG